MGRCKPLWLTEFILSHASQLTGSNPVSLFILLLAFPWLLSNQHGGGSIRWILVLGALIHIWRPEIADGHNISCWLIWQEIFSFHKDILNQVLEKTLESPLDCKEIQPVHSKGDQPWDLFGRNDAKAETPVLWPPHAKSWLWCWEGLGAGGEGDDRGWDGWMASLTRWTWVSVNSRSWCWTGRPGVLRFMGSQRVGHDWAKWSDLIWCLTKGFPKWC